MVGAYIAAAFWTIEMKRMTLEFLHDFLLKGLFKKQSQTDRFSIGSSGWYSGLPNAYSRCSTGDSGCCPTAVAVREEIDMALQELMFGVAMTWMF